MRSSLPGLRARVFAGTDSDNNDTRHRKLPPRIRRVAALSVGLCALLGLLGCSPSEISSLWFAFQLPPHESAISESTCPEGETVLSDLVDREAVMRWAPVVCAVFDPVDAATALCVISYESGGDPNLTNPSDPARGSFGLMQINSDWWIGSESHERMVAWFGRNDDTYLDPAVNIGAAALLLNDPTLPGWHSWTTSSLCPHRH